MTVGGGHSGPTSKFDFAYGGMLRVHKTAGSERLCTQNTMVRRETSTDHRGAGSVGRDINVQCRWARARGAWYQGGMKL